jgi:ParB-like chromosome segregation protein Spo0J
MSWREKIKVHPAADLFPMMSPEELRELGEDIKKHGMNVHIVITPDDEGMLVDGRNRLAAMEMVGMKVIDDYGELDYSIPCRYLEHDPYEDVISANIHRRHLTAEQKRDLIGKLLKATPQKSNRQISDLTKTDDKTVASVRTKMEGRGEIPHVEARTDTMGRQQPAKRKSPEAHQSAEDLQAQLETNVATARAAIEDAVTPATTPAEPRTIAADDVWRAQTRAIVNAGLATNEPFIDQIKKLLDQLSDIWLQVTADLKRDVKPRGTLQ